MTSIWSDLVFEEGWLLFTSHDNHPTRESFFLDESCGAELVVEVSQLVEVLEGVDPRVMGIPPSQTQCVVSNRANLSQFRVLAFLKGDLTAVPLAASAGTETSQDLVGDAMGHPIRPRDLENSGSVRCFDPCWSLRKARFPYRHVFFLK